MDKTREYDIYVTVVRLFSRLPLCIMYIVSDLMFVFMYYVLRYRRYVIDRNLELVFPKQSRKWRDGVARRFCRHLCDNIVETVHVMGMSGSEADCRIRFTGCEQLDKCVSEGHSAIVYLGHYCNWEWVPAVTRHCSPDIVFAQIYRPLRNEAFDRLMLKLRSHFGSVSIPQKQTVRTLIKWHREGKPFIVGFIADQRPNSSNLNHWTTFLGQETAYPAGGEDIGQHVDARYFYFDVEKTSRGHMHINVRPITPLDDGEPYPYTRAYYGMIEQTIRREPAYWLWSHRRWSRKRDGSCPYKQPRKKKTI